MPQKKWNILLWNRSVWKSRNYAFTDITNSCSHEVLNVVVPQFGSTSTLFRFSTSPSLFLFRSGNPLRRFFISLVTSYWFDWIVIAIILSNCVFIALNNVPVEVEYFFASLYTVELIIKVVARGLILQHFAYLKDPWNCLDLIIVIVGWLSLFPAISSLSGLHSMRVIRALRPIAAFPGVRVIVNVILKSLSNLVDVMVLVLFFVLLTAISGMQLLEGGLRNKCVLIRHNETGIPNLQQYAANSSNWYMPEGVPILCGNASGARHCPHEKATVCLPNAGGNPNNGYTNFDNIGWAMLSAFQLITMDFWEDLYNKVIFAYGWIYTIYFILVIFVGSCYTINLTLAVVSFNYQQEHTAAHAKQKTHKTFANALMDKGNHVTFSTNTFPSPFCQPSHQLSKLCDELLQTSGSANTNSHINYNRIKRLSMTGVGVGDRLVRQVESSQLERDIESCTFDFDLSNKHTKNRSNAKSLGALALTLMKAQKSTLAIQKGQSDDNQQNISSGRRALAAIVKHKAFDWTVTAIIVINTILISIQHPGISNRLEQALETCNALFSSVFAAEMLLKIIALGPKQYLTNQWNVFDGFVVVVSMLEMILHYSQVLPTRSLSVIRTFRLFRVLKLSRSWTTMRTLMNVMGSTVTGLFNVSVILFIFIYIFAVVGVHLFGASYKESVPRWNFKDFPHSVMVVFRILCGEWIELLHQTLDTNHVAITIPFFVGSIIVCHFLIINLFIALLLGAFEVEALRRSSNRKNVFIQVIKKIITLFKRLRKVAPATQEQKPYVMPQPNENHTTINNQRQRKSILDCIHKPLQRLQSAAHVLVTHSYFEYFIILIVLASTIPLTFENSKLRFYPERQRILRSMDIAFTSIFAAEMLLKWFGLGLKTYFSSAWNWVDTAILTISVITLMPFSSDSFGALRVIRSLRALRPLRAVSRFKGMKIVVDALMRSVPDMGNVLLFCLLFWFIFSVIGVQLLGNKFYRCVDDAGVRLNTTQVATRNDCLRLYGEDHWINSRINFDNIGVAAVALFQVATFEGWIELMADAADTVDIDQQPSYENSFAIHIFFVAFIMIGSFVLLNLFIGVIIDNFRTLRNEDVEFSALGTLFTPEQKKLVSALKRIGMMKPKRAVVEPKNKILNVCYSMAVSKRFEGRTAVLIMINVVVLSMQHYQQSDTFDFALSTANSICTSFFTIEAIIKLLGLRQHYFHDPWNVFDFIIVLLSLVGVILESYEDVFMVDPTALRLVRILRIGRIIRGVKVAKGLRRLLFTYIFSLPAIINVGAVLLILMLIYAVVGMAMFGTVQHSGGIDENTNFETFGNSLFLLIRISTGAGWNEILDPCMIQPPQCNQTKDGLSNGDCGQPIFAIIYFTSYVLITSLLIINVYVAIFVDNYYQTQQEFVTKLGEDQTDVYYSQWAEKDPLATQYISTSQLSSFIRSLPPPLVPSNVTSIDDFVMTLDTPIYQENKVHCLDLLVSLILKYYRSLNDQQLSDEELKQVTVETEKRFKEIFPSRDPARATTTASKRWLEVRSAIIIQQAFRKYRIKGNQTV